MLRGALAKLAKLRIALMRGSEGRETTLRLTRTGVALTLLLGLSVAVAVAMQDPQVAAAPLAAATGLLGGLSLYAGFASGVLPRMRIEAGEAAAVEGDVAELRVSIMGGRTGVPLRLRFYTALGALESRGLLSGSVATLVVKSRIPYGLWRVVKLEACVGDPLGVYEACQSIGVHAAFIGLPKPLVSESRISLLAAGLAAGRAAGRSSRSGTVFFALREYTPDDDARLIDWRSFARTGRLYVKEFEEETVTTPIFILDVTPTLAAIDAGAPAAAPLARTLLTIALLLYHLGVKPHVYTVTPSGRVLQATTPREYRKILAMVDPLEARNATCSSRIPVLERLLATQHGTILLFTDACLSEDTALLYTRLVSKLRARGLRAILVYTGSELELFNSRVKPVLEKVAAVYSGPPARILREITRWGIGLYTLL